VVIYYQKKRVGAKYQVGLRDRVTTMVLDIIENKEGWRMM
jgi:hypothetical protein